MPNPNSRSTEALCRIKKDRKTRGGRKRGLGAILLVATFSFAPSLARGQAMYPPSSTAGSTVNSEDDSTRTINSYNSGSTNGLPVILFTNNGYNINVTSLAGSVAVDGIPTSSPSVNGAVIYQSSGTTATGPEVGSTQWNAGSVTVAASAGITATNVAGSAQGPGGLLAISQGANGYGYPGVELPSGDDYGNQPFAGTWGGDITINLQDSGAISVTGSGSGSDVSFLTPTLTGISASSIGGNGSSGAYDGGGLDHTPVPFYGNGGGSGAVTVTTAPGTSIEVTQSGTGTNAVGISALSQGGAAGSYYDGGDGIVLDAAGGSAGSVSVGHGGGITVNAEAGVGILASSLGGNGTDGDVAPQNSGGGRPADGGSVNVELLTTGSIAMTSGGIGILAISQAGNWDPLGDTYLPSGGQVTVSVDGGAQIRTGTAALPSVNPFSFGILAISSGNPLVTTRAFESNLTGSGVAGDVSVSNGGSIATYGELAIGIAALGIGGTPAVTTATGGLGNLGNSGTINGANGSDLTLSNSGSVVTLGLSASGMAAISSGGGGIIQNDAAATTSEDGASWVSGMSLGANTDTGTPATDGGDVTVTNTGIVTTGDGQGNGIASLGIIAQSIGGSGGTAGGESTLRNVGDTGGGGGAAGTAEVDLNDGSAVTTHDKNSHAVLVQSIGGGGGNGANASGGFVAVGGVGGDGGSGNTANFSTSGQGFVNTLGNYSAAVVVQSIGGGGGNGGFADSDGAFVSKAIGGTGGAGGTGWTAGAYNNSGSAISTQGNQSAGMIVQSIGGGGGIGGIANSFSVGFIFDMATAVGGSGGGGGNGYYATGINQGTIVTGVAPGSFDNSALVDNTGVLYGTLADGTYMGSVLISSGSLANGVFSGSIGDVTLANGDVIENATISGMTISGTINGVATTQTLKNGGLADALVANASNDTLSGLFLGGKVVTGLGGPNQNGADSIGMIVQSIGGGGGIAGSATAKSLVLPLPTPGLEDHPPTISFAGAIGGSGGVGGEGGGVTAGNDTSIITYGDGSLGILAQSIGGGGGTGGDATATSKAIEGQGSTIQYSVGTAGSGGTAGWGGTVSANNGPIDGSGGGQILTYGQNAAGILAQSIGGGGGNGGTGNAGTSSPYLHNPTGSAFAMSIAVGGGAGVGGSGGNVYVTNYASSLIATFGSTSQGMMGQSIGGGGGNGGGGSSSGAGDKISMDVSVGGGGEGGGDGGEVTMENDGTIFTLGGDSTGILAQSIGGGGGAGGTSDAGATTTPTVVQQVNGGAEIIQKYLTNAGGSYGGEVSLGGNGGAAGDGGVVIVSNPGGSTNGSSDPASWTPGILTAGSRAYGILAQSIGGGGGVGGTATSSSRSATDVFGLNPNPGTQQYTASIKIGGSAGMEASQGTYVTATNYGVIGTHGYGAAAIVTQSIGGGGGVGADGSVDTDVTQFLGMSAGSSEAVQEGGGITVNNDANAGIFTTGRDAPGIVAQSIGGGGGIASTGADAFETIGGGLAGTVDHVMTLGQSLAPSANNAGGTVTVNQTGFIATAADWSHGIVAQSIGSGGGKASAYSTASVTPDLTMTLGAGGEQGDGGNVYINLFEGSQIVTGSQTTGSDGFITRTGYSAFGILAQSIGGGGGLAADLSELSAPVTGSIQLGGQASGEGGAVTLTGTSGVTTYGDAAHAVVLQSISGGGGVGGSGSSLQSGSPALTEAVSVNVSGGYGVGNGGTVSISDSVLNLSTFGANAYGVLAQSIGGGGGLGFAQNASPANATMINSAFSIYYGSDGGEVSLDLDAGSQIVTRGDGAHAIVAQSIGGGGGIANYSSGTPALTVIEGGDSMGTGDGDTVSIAVNGSIYTTGAGAFGILAQSIGGSGGLIGSAGSLVAGTNGFGTVDGGGDVSITQNGTLQATGANSVGIFAQSTGPWPSSSWVAITVNGTVTGGSGAQGFGIWVDGGSNANVVTIFGGGSVSSLSGQAIYYTGNHYLNVSSTGEVAGSIALGGGGGASTFTNNGVYLPGSAAVPAPVPQASTVSASLFSVAPAATAGSSNPVNLDGNYVQGRRGTLVLNFTSPKKHDFLHASGTARFDGKLHLNLTRGFAPEILGTYTLLEADGGVSGKFSSLLSSLPSLAIRVEGSDLTIEQDFAGMAGVRYTPNQKAVARHFDDRARDITKGKFITVLTELNNLSVQPEAVADAFTQLSPEQFSNFASATSFNNATFFTQQFAGYTRRLRSSEGTFLRSQGGIDSSGLTVNDPGMPSLLSQVKSRLDARTLPPVADKLTLAAPEIASPWNLFIQGNVVMAQGFSQAEIAHSEITTGAVQLGVDYRFTPHLIAGVFFGYDHSDATLDHRGSEATMESYRPGLYASYVNGGWYANGLASYGFSEMTSDRHLSFGNYDAVAHGEPGGNEILANLDGGYDFRNGNWTFGPTAGVQYANLNVNSFSEEGAPGADLTVYDQQADSLRTRLGAHVSYAFQSSRLTFVPHLDVSWQHEFLDDSRGVTSQFVDAGRGSFTVQTPSPSRDSVLVNVGIDAEINRRTTLFVDYWVQAGQSSYLGQSVMAGMKIGF